MDIVPTVIQSPHDPAGHVPQSEADLELSPLYNTDLAPTKPEPRKWSTLSIAALWISMSACIPTYTLASDQIAAGMSWWQSVLTIFIGNLIVLFPMVLNAHAGTRYGIPFPVYCRASFGTKGANLPAILRALVACGWFGIQCWIGGQALFTIGALIWPGIASPDHATKFGITLPQFEAFMIFWTINMIVVFLGINSIRWLLNVKAPLLILLGLCLLGWAIWKAGGLGPTFRQHSEFGPDGKFPGQFWTVFAACLTATVGFWATLSLNIPDFSRYARSQRDQIIGQSVGLPTTMALFAFIGVAVTSATIVIFGEAIWDPVTLVGTFHNKWAVGFSMGAIVLATLATNIAANVVSPANDFSNLAPRWIGFKAGGLITGIVGVLMMPWLLYNDPSHYIFIWLGGYSGLLGAVGGILICDYWLMRRTRLRVPELFKVRGAYAYDRGINWCAVLAFCIAITPCIPGFLNTVGKGSVLGSASEATVLKVIYSYSWFVTFFLAFLLYAVFMFNHPNVQEEKLNRRNTEASA